ncbi:MAG: VOC family protein, partial [Candidatus Sulfotelmatobacter sp.]
RGCHRLDQPYPYFAPETSRLHSAIRLAFFFALVYCIIYADINNTWIILNSGGGPTLDKPEVLLETPSNPNRVNSFLDLRVADIRACYKQWRDKGALFLTEPLNNRGWEWRCYMRDPDGYIIEVGQYTQIALDWFTNYAT